ncbi:MAG: PIN domain-containing protein [Burkholderiales bacterium]|nr:PIN domain-containing protein [Burkholderiales bacterium]
MKAGQKVFFDTNVWLSAAVFPGLCAELLLALDLAGHRLLTSALVRAEAHGVLRRKFARHRTALERFDALWACAACVPNVAEPADDADARLVAAARAAGADLFVTGDQRVLDWDAAGRAMRIVSPRQAWAMLVMAGP